MAPTGSWTRLSSTRLMTRPIKSTTLKPMMKKLTMAQTTAMTRLIELTAPGKREEGPEGYPPRVPLYFYADDMKGQAGRRRHLQLQMDAAVVISKLVRRFLPDGLPWTRTRRPHSRVQSRPQLQRP